MGVCVAGWGGGDCVKTPKTFCQTSVVQKCMETFQNDVLADCRSFIHSEQCETVLLGVWKIFLHKVI